MQVPEIMRNNMLKACVGLSLLSMVSGCEKPVAQSDLVGTYVANYAVANEKLTLLPDGKFTQQVTFKSNSARLMTNGLWTFYAADKRIAFEKVFLNVLDGFGQPMKTIEPVTTLLPVVRRFGKV